MISLGAAIVRPEHVATRVDHEAELAVVIGRKSERVHRRKAPTCVLDYACANDVTARDLQMRDEQWTQARGFDTFCPLGSWIVTDLDASDLGIRCRVSGKLRQLVLRLTPRPAPRHGRG